MSKYDLNGDLFNEGVHHDALLCFSFAERYLTQVPEIYAKGDYAYLKGPRGVDPEPYEIYKVLGHGQYKLARNGKSDRKVYRAKDLLDERLKKISERPKKISERVKKRAEFRMALREERKTREEQVKGGEERLKAREEQMKADKEQVKGRAERIKAVEPRGTDSQSLKIHVYGSLDSEISRGGLDTRFRRTRSEDGLKMAFASIGLAYEAQIRRTKSKHSSMMPFRRTRSEDGLKMPFRRSRSEDGPRDLAGDTTIATEPGTKIDWIDSLRSKLSVGRVFSQLLRQSLATESRRWSFKSPLSAFGSGERLLEGGKTRVRWQCVCGHKMYDDFIELRPGAAADLEKWLNHSMRNHAVNRADTSSQDYTLKSSTSSSAGASDNNRKQGPTYLCSLYH